MSARASLVDELGLAPHPEGGYYRETWRVPSSVTTAAGERSLATAILFLLEPGQSSRWHRVRSGELWLWQGGGPLVLSLGGLDASPSLTSEVVVGPDPSAGHALQHLVAPSEWQAARPAGTTYSLVACVVSPDFDFDDFELEETL